jgi:two-component system chemotaxis response regulator CheY
VKTLIVEDELTSRVIMEKFLSPHGKVTICLDGDEGLKAFASALNSPEPFDLVCMDFMLPGIDGRDALARIREMEEKKGSPPSARAKVIMTTGLSNIDTEYGDVKAMSNAILIKPIRKDVFLETLRELGLISTGHQG